MDEKDLSHKDRISEFQRLYGLIPEKTKKDKNKWIINNLYCSSVTVRVWGMKNSPRPIPEDKLRIMRDMLTPEKLAQMEESAKKLQQQYIDAVGWMYDRYGIVIARQMISRSLNVPLFRVVKWSTGKELPTQDVIDKLKSLQQ